MELNIFPGFTTFGVVSPAIQELAVTFNAEALSSISTIPEFAVQWANVGTRTSKCDIGKVKIPVDVSILQGFEAFEGERRFHSLDVAAVEVKVTPFDLNQEWDIRWNNSGNAELVKFMGLAGLPMKIISHGRALKADMAEKLIESGMTNSVLGMVAKALVLDTGIPLFSDGSATAPHPANPLTPGKNTFINLHYGAGKFTDPDVLGQCLMDLNQVPHPSKLDMTMGLTMTDVVGPPHMLMPFYKAMIQNLALEVQASAFAATTNIMQPELLAKASAQMGANGLGPWKFWIAPQMAAHPYVKAYPGRHMWMTIARSAMGGSWAEFGAPSPDFTPILTLLGDGTESARLTRKVRMIGDLDAGVAAGLPHFAQLYFETTPA
jgi:hypothetical protein